MKTYKTNCIGDEILTEAVPTGNVDFFNWEEENPYSPETTF